MQGLLPTTRMVTGLLLRWGQGDHAALERLIPLVHHELHRIARRCMAGEGVGNSLQATALVNEAYLRLVDGKAVAWNDRAHFLAVSARVMRASSWITRAPGAPKNAAASQRRCRSTRRSWSPMNRSRISVALDDALEALARFDERKSRVVEMSSSAA